MDRRNLEPHHGFLSSLGGSSKVSAGCKNSCAETMAMRLKAMGAPGYENGFEFTMIPPSEDKCLSVWSNL
jgi:protein gp37